EPFRQGDGVPGRAAEGLGLGLSLVRSLVLMHGGTVAAASPGVGRGSTFTARLPVGGESVPAAVVAPPAPRGDALRSLVVDDNPDAARSLALLLRLDGHEVRVADDGPSALRTAAEFRPEAVLLDIGLPGMDGNEVAKRLRATPGLERSVL